MLNKLIRWERSTLWNQSHAIYRNAQENSLAVLRSRRILRWVHGPGIIICVKWEVYLQNFVKFVSSKLKKRKTSWIFALNQNDNPVACRIRKMWSKFMRNRRRCIRSNVSNSRKDSRKRKCLLAWPSRCKNSHGITFPSWCSAHLQFLRYEKAA